MSRGEEMPSTENGNNSDGQQNDGGQNKSKTVQSLLTGWWKNSLAKPKDRNDELPKLPKRRIPLHQTRPPPSQPSTPSPSPPDTTSHTTNVDQTNTVAQNDVEDANENDGMNDDVIVSSGSPNVITKWFPICVMFLFLCTLS